MEKTIELSDERRAELAQVMLERKTPPVGEVNFRTHTTIKRAVKSILPRRSLRAALLDGAAHSKMPPKWVTGHFFQKDPIQVSGVFGTGQWYVLDLIQRLRTRPMPLYKALKIRQEAMKRLEEVDAAN
jgi:hypothetical protein